MRVIVTSLPLRGHLNSTLPTALALRDSGHDVFVLASAQFAGELASIGLRHRAAGYDTFEEARAGVGEPVPAVAEEPGPSGRRYLSRAPP